MLYITHPRIQTIRGRLTKTLLALCMCMEVQSGCNPKDWTGRNNTSHHVDGHGKFISVSLTGCIELMDISFRMDVNYSGSSGYGRKYRERLRNHWGIVDTNDCITSVQELSAHRKLIDSRRVCIRGGAAGGGWRRIRPCPTEDIREYSLLGHRYTVESPIWNRLPRRRTSLNYKFVGGALADVPWIYEQKISSYMLEIPKCLWWYVHRVATMNHWYIECDGGSCMEIKTQ